MLTKLNPNLGLEEPDEELINSLVTSEMISQMPTGTNWFSENALQFGEVGKLLKSLAKEISAWIYVIKSSKNGLFISNAKEAFLDRWGKDVGIARQSGETDEQFRFRIKKTLILSRVTKKSIEEIVFDNTKLEIDYTYDPVKVLEPWIFQERKSKRHPSNTEALDRFYGRSGQTKRTGSDRQTNYTKTALTKDGLVYYPEVIDQCYYQGGVIDVVTPGFSRKTLTIVFEMIAAGIKPFFTAAIKYQINNPFLGSSEKIQSNADVAYDTGGNFIANYVITRSGKKVEAGEFSFLQEERLDIVGLQGKSGSKTIFIGGRFVEYESNLVSPIPRDFPEIGSGDNLLSDSFPAFRSTFRKELSPRSGARGDTELNFALGWTADKFVEFASGAVFDTRSIEYEGFGKFNLIHEKLFKRSFSRRSGPVNPFTDTELYTSEPLAVNQSTTLQLEAEIYRFSVIGSLKSILNIALFPRSGSFGETSVLLPVNLELPLLTDFLVYDEVQAVVFTELGLSTPNKLFAAGNEYPVKSEVEYELFTPSITTLIGTSSESENIENNILSKTWEQLASYTWEEVSSLGGYVQLQAEVVISN
jgi:hypothetical protein